MIMIRGLSMALLLATLLGTSTLSAYAATKYVDPVNGSDSPGGGDFNNGWKTIAYALTQVSSGDTVIVMDGQVGPIGAGGNGESLPVALKRGVSVVTLNGPSGTVVDATSAVQAFTLTAAGTSMVPMTLAGFEIIGNKSTSQMTAIFVRVRNGSSSADLEIRDNVIHDVEYGIRVETEWLKNPPLPTLSPGTAALSIHHNTFYDVSDTAIEMVPEDDATSEGGIFNGPIFSNVFFDVGRAIHFKGVEGGATYTNCELRPQIEHNSIYRSGAFGHASGGAIMIEERGDPCDKVEPVVSLNSISCAVTNVDGDAETDAIWIGKTIDGDGGTFHPLVAGNFCSGTNAGLRLIADDTGGNQATVKNNILSDNIVNIVIEPDPGGDATLAATLTNNVIAFAGQDGIHIVDSTSTSFAVDVINCTVAANGQGLGTFHGLSDNGSIGVSGTIYNSIFWFNAGARDVETPSSYTCAYDDFEQSGISGSNLISSEPYFVNRSGSSPYSPILPPRTCGEVDDEGEYTADPPSRASNPNLYLQKDSPCVDAGSNSLNPESTDLEGDDRVVLGLSSGTATIDMGADEFDTQIVYVRSASWPFDPAASSSGAFWFQTPPQQSGSGHYVHLYLSYVDGFDLGGFVPADQPCGSSGTPLIWLEDDQAVYPHWMTPANFSGCGSSSYRIKEMTSTSGALCSFSWPYSAPPQIGSNGSRVYFTAIHESPGDSCRTLPTRFLVVQ